MGVGRQSISSKRRLIGVSSAPSLRYRCRSTVRPSTAAEREAPRHRVPRRPSAAVGPRGDRGCACRATAGRLPPDGPRVHRRRTASIWSNSRVLGPISPWWHCGTRPPAWHGHAKGHSHALEAPHAVRRTRFTTANGAAPGAAARAAGAWPGRWPPWRPRRARCPRRPPRARPEQRRGAPRAGLDGVDRRRARGPGDGRRLRVDLRSTRTPGFDVSNWQGNVNWASAYAKGGRFAYIKATEGTTYRDPTFNANYTNSYYAGFIRGAYHFATPDSSGGKAQADYFVSHGGGWSKDGKTLPPLLDIEYSKDGTCYGMSKAAMVTWISAFVNEVHARTTRWATIYTTTSWWTTCTGNTSAFSANDPLFVARYASSAGALPAGWPFYTLLAARRLRHLPRRPGLLQRPAVRGDGTSRTTPDRSPGARGTARAPPTGRWTGDTATGAGPAGPAGHHRGLSRSSPRPQTPSRHPARRRHRRGRNRGRNVRRGSVSIRQPGA